MRFTAACAQIAPLKAELQANLDKIAAITIQASEESADLVVFPEASTTGYFLEGGVVEVALESGELCAELTKRLDGKLTRPVDVMVGFYEAASGNLHNSAAYLEFDGSTSRVVHVYRKFFLPTYGVFDEERFVNRGKQLGVFETRFGCMGILICEDVWHSVLPALTAMKGAQIILVPSASPARNFSGEAIGNLDRYHRLLTAVSEEHGVYCINCQLTGFEGGKGLVGGSAFFDPAGRIMAQSPVQEEHLLLASIDMDLVEVARAQSPLLSDLQNAWAGCASARE